MSRESRLEKLECRLNKNYKDFVKKTLKLSKRDIINEAGRIAAVADAYLNLTESKNLDESAIDYLLLFQNPLAVVADKWLACSTRIDRFSYVLEEILDKKDALKGEYKLFSELKTHAPLSRRKVYDDGEGSTIDLSNIDYERIAMLTEDTRNFINKKPIAVLFGDEFVEAYSWSDVYATVLRRCNRDARYHETLMSMRGEVRGKVREFISHSPDEMIRPKKIDDALYAEVQYGVETLMHILVDCILTPVGYDYSNIRVVIKNRRDKGISIKD